MSESLACLVASVSLPHVAHVERDGAPIGVAVTSAGVEVDGRVLTRAEACQLSRAVRRALEGPRSDTVRPAGGPPLMVCRIGDDLVRVDGRVLTRREGLRLAVALDRAAAHLSRLCVVVLTKRVMATA